MKEHFNQKRHVGSQNRLWMHFDLLSILALLSNDFTDAIESKADLLEAKKSLKQRRDLDSNPV